MESLLKRFEPILYFTQGEQFFPMDVDPYVHECSLWKQFGRQKECLVPKGELNLNDYQTDETESIHFLKFVDDDDIEKLNVAKYRMLRHNFSPGRNRLARVGYLSRLADVIFSISLFARGRVPGDTAIGAWLKYQQIMANNEHYSYYGRVVRQDDWLVLQYWYFYAFNNWRSGFSGVNDHEGDWEMISIYLYETENDVYPEWIAYSTHDGHGDDLRRHWDDPELDKIGEHPIAYVSAGSHANYFQRGEYVTEFTFNYFNLLNFFNLSQDYFYNKNIRVPYIDYARGDLSMSIGYEQIKEWQLRLLNQAWLKYRGLWGLYTRDPISGEDAPGGPMYNRDGSVRLAWYDPVSWAGLTKVLPPNRVISHAKVLQDEILARQDNLNIQINDKLYTLRSLTIEWDSIQGIRHLKKLNKSYKRNVDKLFNELINLRNNYATNKLILESIDKYINTPPGNQKAKQRPKSIPELRYARLAEMWASISISFFMICFVLLFYFAPQDIIIYLASLIIMMIFIEAIFRKQLYSLITKMLAIGVFILIFQFAREILGISILIIGIYIMWENLKEIVGTNL